MNYLVRFLLVFVYATTSFIPSATDCPEHTYAIGTKEFTWPETPNSDLWIASDCLDLEKRLIFRRCLNNTWMPSNNDFQMMCHFENAELPSNDCPRNFKSFKLQQPTERNICIRRKGFHFDFIKDRNVCIKDSILTMHHNIEQQSQSIKSFTQNTNDSLFVQTARSIFPRRKINKNVDSDVELHDVQCGRYGLPVKFNDSVPVHCTKQQCDNLCLYLNATTEPYSQMIDTCQEYLIAKPVKTFLHELGCPIGYHRIENDYVESGNLNACFSIQMFQQPIPVKDIENENIIQSYCNETIMNMNAVDSLFVFRQISEHVGLSDGNQCLFGLTLRHIIKYSDWNSLYFSRNLIFNWDKTMNYSRINEPGAVSLLAIKPNGQFTWAVDTVSCIVCMVDSPIPTATLQLSYDILERKLELTVTNQDFLYKENSFDLGFICFSVFREVYKANLTVFPIAKGKYLIEDAGIGQYWCSGHNVISRTYVSTGDRIFAFGILFSFHVVRKCTANCSYRRYDLQHFIECFNPSNEHFVTIEDSTIIDHGERLSDTEYSFTVLLSLTFNANAKDNFVTDLVNLTDYELETLVIYDQLKKGIFYDELNELNIKSVRSTEYCLHESLLSIESILWHVARIGETIQLSSICPPQGNNSETTRTCSGDFVNGSFWKEPVDAPSCHTFVSENLLNLYLQFTYSGQSSAILDYLENLLEENIKILLPLDMFLTSRILQKVANLTIDDVQNMFSIFNTLMLVDENLLNISASLNTTNVLLDVLDNNLLDYITSSAIGSSEYQIYGNSSIHSPLIETFVFSPVLTGASGIALYKPRNSTSDDDFAGYSMKYLNSNEDEEVEISDKDLVVESYLPPDKLTCLKNSSVVMTVFFNDKLFQSTDLSPEKIFFKTKGKIISIIRLDATSKLLNITPIYLDSNQANASECKNSSGCNLRQISVRTHFSNIITRNDNVYVEDHTLKLIEGITSSFCFFGTLGIFLTAVLAKKWRKKFNSKILIHFAAAITLTMLVMLSISVNQRLLSVIANNSFACAALGSIIHYSTLVMYFWMLIFVYFQLKRYVAIFNFSVSRVLFKSIVFGWIVPILPICIILILDHTLYLPQHEEKFCYPNGWALYLGVVAPIALISFVDFVAFILISLRRESSNLSNMAEVTTMRLSISAILFVAVVSMWSFGFLSKIFQNSYTMLSFICCVTAAVQGFGLFLNFIVFDPIARSLWLKFFRKIMCRRIQIRRSSANDVLW